MPVQLPLPGEAPVHTPPPPPIPPSDVAPVWLQRISLFILVIFCVYLGVIMVIFPWWSAIWDYNALFLAHPKLGAFMRLGAVRGIFSGLGMLDIWIGISEAIHYRDHRP